MIELGQLDIRAEDDVVRAHQRGEFGVHVAQDCGDGGLFVFVHGYFNLEGMHIISV